jgi:hypothetical protein
VSEAKVAWKSEALEIQEETVGKEEWGTKGGSETSNCTSQEE